MSLVSGCHNTSYSWC